MFGNNPEAAGSGIFGGIVVICILLYYLAGDHVVHDKIQKVYRRFVKQ